MALAPWLLTLVAPLVLRALTVLGLGVVTFTGVTVAVQNLINVITTNWASLPADVLGLASVAGLPQCLGIVCGAITGKVALWVAVSATRFVVSPAS